MTAGPAEPLWSQCVAVAGALAEAGVQSLTLVTPDGRAQVFATRGTDLPGILLRAAPGSRIEVEPIGLRIAREHERLVATHAGDPAAGTIAAAIAAQGQ